MEPRTERAKKVAAVAARLRIVQAELADEPADQRQEHLGDEVQRALGGMSPDEQKAFLGELMSHFPTFDEGSAKADAAAADSTRPLLAALEGQLRDPKALCDRLIEAMGPLPDAQKQAIRDKLAAAGLVETRTVAGPAPAAAPSGGGEVSEAGSRALRLKLKLGDKDPVDTGRVYELSAVLSDCVMRLDRVVWQAWSSMAPHSNVKRREMIERVAGQMAMGRPEVQAAQVSAEVERLQKLSLAIIASVSKSGSIYAQRWNERFSVDAVKRAAQPRKKLAESFDTTCWKVYSELAQNMDTNAIAQEITGAIVENVEKLMNQ